MSQGMLGNLSLSDTQGPRKDIEDKLAGSKGTMWLRRLKRFLRGENPFGVPKTFEVTTDGRSGEQHITDLEAQGDQGHQLRQVIQFPAEEPARPIGGPGKIRPQASAET